MRCLIQRVSEAKVMAESNTIGQIKNGLLIFVGISNDDTDEDIRWIASKIIQMRIFSDDNGKMNKSITDVNGDVLIVSQFTLFASTKKGNRPSFTNSAPADFAEMMYKKFITECENLLQKKAESGVFAADMKVSLINDGPVTIWIDSKNRE